MPHFDPHLMAFLIALNALAIAAAILLVARDYPRNIGRSMRIFGWGKILLAVAFVLAAGREILPAWGSIVLANSIGVAGFYSNFFAVRVLQDKPYGWLFPAALVALVLAGTAYFTLVHVDLMGVRVVVSVALTVVLGMLSWELLACYRLPGSAHLITGIASLAAGGAFQARIIAALGALGGTVAPDPDSWIEKGFLLTVYLGAALTTVTFVLMCNDAFNSELRNLAATDPLSGLANRRRLFERGEDEVRRASRFHHTMTVAVIDIDHFKQINDSWGHATGDRVIVAVARRLSAEVREVDLVARLGSEEFVVLLPETGLEAAAEMAERHRQAIAAAMIGAESGAAIPITVSIGLAAWAAGSSFEDLLRRADAAMYEARKSGRNRIGIAP